MFGYSFRVFLALLVSVFLVGCTSYAIKFNDYDFSRAVSSESIALVPVQPIVEFPTPIDETPLPVPLFELHQNAVVRFTREEIRCMATAMYHEAKGEGVVGQASVGYVILNRMAHTKFPNRTVCGTVYERNRYRCEFSWVCEKSNHAPRNWRLYNQIEEVAVAVLRREIENPIDNSVFFRTGNRPHRYEKFVARVGGHSFYARR